MSPWYVRYGYTMTIGDIRGTTTTTTDSGTMTVLNESASPFGAGWTLSGLGKMQRGHCYCSSQNENSG